MSRSNRIGSRLFPLLIFRSANRPAALVPAAAPGCRAEDQNDDEDSGQEHAPGDQPLPISRTIPDRQAVHRSRARGCPDGDVVTAACQALGQRYLPVWVR